MNGSKKIVIWGLAMTGLLELYGCGSPASDFTSQPEAAQETTDFTSQPEAVQEATDFTSQPEAVQEATDFTSQLKAVQEATDFASQPKAVQETPSAPAYEGSMDLAYAENFTVDYYEDGYKLLTTTMDNKCYLIVPEGGKTMWEPGVWGGETVILQHPVDDIYLVASSVMDMFDALGGMERIAFSGQKEDGWYIEAAREAMERGDIRYAGKYNKPDYELIVSGHCKLAIENMMISHAPEVVEKLEDFNIPVLIDYSSYESHPLGRVEWVKFYGALLGREEEAERIFEEQAEILEKVTADVETGQTVAFFFITSNGLVQVRQSSDYVPKMIELAGGRYIFEDLGETDTKRSTMNMQVEEFYHGAKDADFLIYNSSIDGGVANVEELIDKCGLLADFKAVREGNVWCTTNDMYQQSLSVGYLMEDIHAMLRGETDGMHYLFRLE